jgi:hypothetical protein
VFDPVVLWEGVGARELWLNPVRKEEIARGRVVELVTIVELETQAKKCKIVVKVSNFNHNGKT